LKKFKWLEKKQNGGQKLRWHRVDFLKCYRLCKKYFFDANLLILGVISKKILFRSLGFEKIAAKFKMASETYFFVILLSKLQISKIIQDGGQRRFFKIPNNCHPKLLKSWNVKISLKL
jgi:hypothetical protein